MLGARPSAPAPTGTATAADRSSPAVDGGQDERTRTCRGADRVPKGVSARWPEREYCVAWAGTALSVGGSCAVVGLLSLPLVETIGIAAAIGVLTSLGQQLLPHPRSRSVRYGITALAALIGTGGCVSVVGMVRFLGPVGTLLIALFAATCSAPAPTRRCSHKGRQERRRSG